MEDVVFRAEVVDVVFTAEVVDASGVAVSVADETVDEAALIGIAMQIFTSKPVISKRSIQSAQLQECGKAWSRTVSTYLARRHR